MSLNNFPSYVFQIRRNQITTTTDFDQGVTDPASGDLTNSSVEMRVKLCYYEDSDERKILDIYPRVKAVDFDTQKGIRTVTGGAHVGYVSNDDYIGYKQVNFGPSGSTKSILIHYAKGNNTTNAKVELRIGSPTGTLIGEIPTVPTTNSWFTFETLKVALDQNVDGVQDIYIVGKGDNGVFNLDWFELSNL